MSLAVTEGLVLFLAVCGTIYAWGHPLLVDWVDLATLLWQAGAVSLCCIVAFYYNDLYDLRVVRSFSLFASRLLQSFGVALILLAGFYTAFPNTRLGEGAFVSSLIVSAGLLVPLRALGYTIMRRRAFADRVLILGTGAAARRVIDETELPLRDRWRRDRRPRDRRE
jgi:FlaA1/EpsC-like NDP-sugar epimerase